MAGESADASARRMRSKAERLARAAGSYERGAAGERITADVLATLPSSEWTVFHDLRWPGRRLANVDHVAVGPAGVFVIDSKNWSGSITAHQGVLRQNGRLRQPSVSAAADAARAVARVATSTSPTHVHPVLCFVGDEEVKGRAGEVLLCSPTTLLTLLQSRPPVLTEATRLGAYREIDAFMCTATGAGSMPEPRPRRRPRAATKSTRRGRGVGRELSRLVGVLVGAVALLMLITSSVPAQIAELLTSVMTSEDTANEPPNTDQPKGTKKKNPPTRPRDQKPGQARTN